MNALLRAALLLALLVVGTRAIPDDDDDLIVIGQEMDADASSPPLKQHLSRPPHSKQRAPPPAPARSISWGLHLTDIHLNIDYPDRLHSLEDLVRDIIPTIQPEKVIITGDLVDAKRKDMRAEHRPAEWLQYAQLLDTISAAGVPRDAVLDVRGNHDMFDVGLRGGARDGFMKHAAKPGTHRVLVTGMYGKLEWVASGGAAGSWEVAARPEAPGGGEKRRRCPAAALLGIDWSPAVGLKGPLNFAGLLTREVQDAVEDGSDRAGVLKLQCAVMSGSGAASATPVIAYGHQPLSAISNAGRSTKSALSLLLSSGVAVYLNGHLHTAFGNNTHRVWEAPTERSEDRSFMLEIMGRDHKINKAFRVLAVDDGRVSWVDLAHRGGRTVGTDPDVVVHGAVLAVTAPADARYSPLDSLDAHVARPREVHALVWPVAGSADVPACLRDSPGAPVADECFAAFHAGIAVHARWSCVGPERYGDLGPERLSGDTPLTHAGGALPLYAGELPPETMRCESDVRLQVVARTNGPRTGRDSTSRVVRTRSPGAVAAAAARGRRSLLEEVAPRKLDLRFLEWLALAPHWQALMVGVSVAAWTLHLASLAVPRALLKLRGDPPRARRTRRWCCGLSPTALLGGAFLDAAACDGAWRVQLANVAALAVVPWALCHVSTQIPPAALTPWGLILVDLRTELLTLFVTGDTTLVTVPHYLFFLLPVAWWTAQVLSLAASHAARSARPPPRRAPAALALHDEGSVDDSRAQSPSPPNGAASPRSPRSSASPERRGRRTRAPPSAKSGFQSAASRLPPTPFVGHAVPPKEGGEDGGAAGLPWWAIRSAVLHPVLLAVFVAAAGFHLWMCYYFWFRFGWWFVVASPGVTWQLPVTLLALAASVDRRRGSPEEPRARRRL
ncbi:unnamed protein product [Pedinophyceae sp. YPF-701]|nr:unnamed protein product [Pedinophyceae sp. YPF-701]